MAKDPVCGIDVEESSAAAKHVYKGQTYFFCSHYCLAKFKENPEKFLRAPAREHLAHTHAHEAPQTPKIDKAEDATYVCPMDAEVCESKSGACPKCGMALEPAAPSFPALKTEYVCPMHPEIVRPEPGFCPICGMALEPRTVSLEDEPNPDLVDMTRRFWISAILSLPVLVLAMSDMIPGNLCNTPCLLVWLLGYN